MKPAGMVLLYDEPVGAGVTRLPTGLGGFLKSPFSLVLVERHRCDYSGYR